MAIPEAQLETWSHQGSIVQSSSTYGSIKAVLEAGGTPYSGKNYRVFLQGSYGNDTNIYAESDVDVVICLDDCFHSDLSDLSPPEKDAYNQAYSNATYTFTNFKHDVLATLQRAYGADVTAGKKAIAIAANGARRKADVVPAVQYRRYSKFRSALDQSYVEGICFFTADGTRIANYPKQHSANLTSKHQRTSNRLKPLVRSIKNLRGRLVADGRISNRTAPSYFLEGLWYNVPDRCFSPSMQQSFVNAINWLQGEADTSKLLCANEQYYLLWDNEPTSWAPGDYRAFLQAMIALWNNW